MLGQSGTHPRVSNERISYLPSSRLGKRWWNNGRKEAGKEGNNQKHQGSRKDPSPHYPQREGARKQERQGFMSKGAKQVAKARLVATENMR